MAKVQKKIGQVLGTPASLDAIQERERAEWKVETYLRHYELSIAEVTGLSKWLNGSLFAASSGGVLTVLNQSEKLADPMFSGLAFVSGLCFALLGATANQEHYNQISEPLLNLVSYWQEVKISGIADVEKQKTLETALSEKLRFTWFGPIFGWISGLSFVAGASLVAAGLS